MNDVPARSTVAADKEKEIGNAWGAFRRCQGTEYAHPKDQPREELENHHRGLSHEPTKLTILSQVCVTPPP